jgi:hypothetical protein
MPDDQFEASWRGLLECSSLSSHIRKNNGSTATILETLARLSTGYFRSISDQLSCFYQWKLSPVARRLFGAASAVPYATLLCFTVSVMGCKPSPLLIIFLVRQLVDVICGIQVNFSDQEFLAELQRLDEGLQPISKPDLSCLFP